MPATDIAGYLQGYRFSSAAADYDSGVAFLDKAGFGPSGVADMSIDAGTPSFRTVGGDEGVVVDNTWHGRFRIPIMWEGTIVLVGQFSLLTSGTQNRTLIVAGNSATFGVNARLVLSAFGSERRWQLAGANGTLQAPNVDFGDATTGVFVASHDQSTRKAYSSDDAVTVNETSALSGTTNGNGIGMTMAADFARFGDLDWNSSNTTVDADIEAVVFEMHFFAGNPLVSDLASVKSFVDELKTEYGVS